MKREYRMLSFVQRWSIAPRLHHQTVAEHSFFVALYASELCSILQLSQPATLQVMEYALRHDAEEAWLSDIPGPAKRSITDPERLAVYQDQFGSEMGKRYQDIRDLRDKHLTPDFTIADVIKVADLIDSVFFLQVEDLLGNRFAAALFDREWERLEQALAVLGPERRGAIATLVELELERMGDIGAIIPANDGDLK